MGRVNRILQLQRDCSRIAGKYKAARKQWETLNARYGGSREQRATRLEEIRRELLEVVHWETGEHAEFDARHNVQVSGSTRTWKPVRGCPDCDRKEEECGRNALKRERDQIYEWGRELNGCTAQVRDQRTRAEAVVFDINREARYLGLPSFKADITGKGFITGTGTVQNFSAHGQYVLDSGTSVTYGNTTVVLDSSEQLVAYRLGDGNWTLMRVLARPKITTDKGWYTVMRSTGVIEMMVGPDGESTNTYPHVHVIHDSQANQIRVVVSRSSSDHSSPEILPGDAYGNEVNAAILRALQQL